MECEKCGYEFSYQDPSATRSYYVIGEENEAFRGREKTIAYCKQCAPFGNTKIPGKLQ